MVRDRQRAVDGRGADRVGVLKMKTGSHLGFDRGSLHIKKEGYGDDKRGAGEFVFDDLDLDDLPLDPDSESDARPRSITLPRSELEAIRDFITKTLAEIDAYPGYAETFCSSCGAAFGPGPHGFSHCDQHEGKAGQK